MFYVKIFSLKIYYNITIKKSTLIWDYIKNYVLNGFRLFYFQYSENYL